MCSLCTYILSNKKLNVGIEVLNNGFTSSKECNSYNKFNARVDKHTKCKTHRQSVIRLTNICCIKDTNTGIIGNLLSMACTEHTENQ